MFKYILIFTALFSVLLAAYPATRIEGPPDFYLEWYYDLDGQVQTPRPAGWRSPFNAFFRPGDKGGALHFPDRPVEPVAEGTLISAPFHGAGYFEYQKVGRDIQFRESSRGEVLWKKSYYSYPISDHYGDLILLLTGDSNRVDLLDPSGNPLGLGSVSGNVLNDYDFAARQSRALLVFAGGNVTALDKTGQALFHHQLESDSRPFFVKSCALGPDGLVAAVHYRAGDRDEVVLLARREEGQAARVLGRAVLPKIYPHLLHMAVSPGGLLVSAPDFTGFYDTDGDPVWNRPLADRPVAGAAAGPARPIYRPVYADRSFFLFGEGASVFVLDGRGRVVAVLPVRDEGRPFRFLPGPDEGSFAIHTHGALHFYRFRPQAAG